MSKRRFRLPSPALVISMITLSLVLGGTAVAATATHGDKKADTKLIKKLAPTLSVKHAKTADSATNATTATNATNATTATNAGNASSLGGTPASSFEKFNSTLPPGTTETGIWGAAGGDSTSGYETSAIRFYPPLPAALDSMHVIYTATTATHCSGLGAADPGYLCVYGQSTSGVTFLGISPGHSATGASVSGADVFFTINSVSSFAEGAWAVTAPITAAPRASDRRTSHNGHGPT